MVLSPALAELEDARPLSRHEFMDFRAKQERIGEEADAITVDHAGLVGRVQVESEEEVVWPSSHQKVFQARLPSLRKGRWLLCLDGIPE